MTTDAHEALMRLDGIAAGKTQSIEMRAGTVQTAFLKAPVPGRSFVHQTGLEGNETAVHPDDIYGIASEHYEFWAARLGADRSEWLPGHFAENLTIAGLDESTLRIGDIVAIGPEVTLIVTGPRIPCFKLAWRLGQPDSFIREFGLSARSGVYFGVRQTGFVEAGMAVRIVHREPAHPTVAEVAQLALDTPQPSEQPIRTLLALPYFSKSAALVLGSLLMRVVDQPSEAGQWRDWREFTVADTVDETADVKSFRLVPSDGLPLPRTRAGQFVAVSVPLPGADAVIRPWSLSDYAENPSSFRITIKRNAGGGSARLHASAVKGARLMLRPPAGRFMLDRAGFMPVVLIGAGIGITPLLAMAKAHLARGDNAPPLRIIHCVRNADAHPLRREIDSLAAHHPRLRAHYVYSQPTPEDVAQRRFHRHGHLTVDDVISELDGVAISLGNKRVTVPWFESDFYICGPDPFETCLVAALLERGARKQRVFFERFQSHGDDPAADSGLKSALVVFARSGNSATWNDAEGLTLLELAEKAGLAPAYGCRIGVCLSCQCEILEGDVRYDSRPVGEIAERTALLCCAKPATDNVVLAL